MTGVHANLRVNRWDGTIWTQYNTTGASPTITVTGVTETTAPLNNSEYTGRVNPAETYRWNQTDAVADWTVPANWTPARLSPQTNDILIFDNNGTTTATNVPTQTIERLVISNTSDVTLEAALARTLTISDATGTELDVNSVTSLTVGTNLNLTLAAASTATVDGTLIVNSGRTFTTNAAGTVTTVSGTIINQGTITSTITGLVIPAGGTFVHNLDGGTVPTATWDVASNLNITGLAAATPGGLTQTFGNFNYNSPYIMPLGANLTVTGNLDISGGSINGQGRIINLSGNLTGTNDLIFTTGRLNITGDYSNTGTFTYGTSSTVEYNGTAQQVKGAIYYNLIISGGDIKIISAAVQVNGTLTLTSGLLQLGDYDLTLANTLAFLVNCPVSNINVTGGTVQIIPTTGTVLADVNYFINSTAPVNNLIINRVSGAATVQLNTNPLIALNDLTLTSGALIANNQDVTVGGNFLIAAGTIYTAGTNTTTLNGSGTQTFTVDIAAPLSLNKLTIDKPSGIALDFAGSQPIINVASDFSLVLGTLNDNGNTINIAGNVYNSGTHAGAGKIVLNGTLTQSIDGNGIFNHIELNNTNAAAAPVSLAANCAINGSLTFSQDKLFNINTFNLRLNSGALINNGGALRYIQSAGNAGDGGLTKVYSSPVPFDFPIGVVNYTPATIGLSSAPTAYGSITVIPVNFAHSNVTTPGRSLSYFWRTKSAGFTLGAATVTHGYTYDQSNVITGVGITEDEYVAARFDISASTWTSGTVSDVDETGNIIGEPGIGSFLENVTFIDGDYTAGDNNPINPFGIPQIFYSRINGAGAGFGLWSNVNTWSTDPILKHTGAAAATVPGISDIVVIGALDSVYLATDVSWPYTTPNVDPRSCASLQIEIGSALDIGYNPNSSFGMVLSHPGGNGNFRFTTSSASGSTYIFPPGDFSDFNVNLGTTEMYSTNPIAGTTYWLPNGTATYGNLILSPLGGSNIIFPNNDLTISSGTFILGANAVTLLGDFINDASYTDDNSVGSGLILNGIALQHITGFGAFARMTLNNVLGAQIENNITLQEDLTMTLGILDIKTNLVTLGVNSLIQGAPFGATKMITSDGVFSNVGLRKFFNPGATTFLYPIGTSGKYTPALLTITASSTVGYVRINNNNSNHPAVIDPTNALDYYWEVQSSGITGFSGNLVLNYLERDVVGDESNYLAARLIVPGTTWSQTLGVDPALNTITYNYITSNNLSGEYTAGTTTAFPANVPEYTSDADGNWTNQAIWTQTGGDPYPVPPGGPNGFIVNINHEVTIDANYSSAYRTTINNKLIVPSTYYGHNLDTVDGSGTLYLESGTFPAGVFTSFLSCSNNSTVEYGGTGTYTIIADLYDNIANIIFSGTGTRVLPNKDLTICSHLIIDGPTLDNSVYNKKLTIQGSMERYNTGAFKSGTGAGATVSFAGTGSQTIGGSFGDFSGTNAFNNFEINNGAGLLIDNLGEIGVKGNLLLTNGLINTGANRKLTITNSAINCVIPAGGSSTSFVNGPLIKQISQYDNFLFPIGIYIAGPGNMLGNNLKLSSTQTGPVLWSAEYKSPNGTSGSVTAPLVGVSEQEYYTVIATVGSQTILNINWTPTSDVTPLITGGLSNIRLANYNTGASSWVEIPTSSSGNNFNGTATSTGLVTSTGSDDYTLGSITDLKPRAKLSPTGPVCGIAGIPVTFTAPYAIPFDYTLNYMVDGVPQVPVTVTSGMVPYSLPTPTPGVYKLTDFTYNSGTLTGVVDETTVTTYADPTLATAGLDQTLCGITTAILAGNTPVVGSGLWSIISGSGGTLITPSSPSSQFIGLNGVAYTLRWTITNGTCLSSDDVNINFTILPDPPAASAAQGFCGAATIADLVATPPAGCTVDWYSAASGGVLLPGGLALVDGTTYYAESNGGAGCSSASRTAVVVTINPVPVPSLNGISPVCLNSTGNVYTTDAGKSNYAWLVVGGFITSGGTITDNTATVTWNTVGSQTISVNYEGVGGCTAVTPTPYNVTVNALPTPTLTSSDLDNTFCIGTSVTFTAGGGTNYDFRIDGTIVQSGASVTYITTTLTNGQTVDVIVTNAGGCTASSGGIINTVNPILPVSVVIAADANPVCAGTTVTFTATPTNGGTPSYQWYNGAAPVGADNPVYAYVPADGDIITVVLTSSETCQSGGPATSNAINMTVDPIPTVTITDPATVCSPSTVDLTDAAVTAGSTAGLTFTYWTDAAATLPYVTETAATAGTYYIKGTDASGCYEIQPVIVVVNPIPAVSSTKTDILCFGEATGAIDITVVGGVGPYTFAWTGSGVAAASEDQTGLAAGPYSVIVTDANSCTSASLPVTLTEPGSAVSGSTTQTNVSVFGGNDGEVTVTGSGGTGPYLYAIDAGPYQASGTFGTLTAGSYVITVQDANLCTFDVPFTITQPALAFTGSISAQTDVSCFGSSDGSVTVSGAGGTSPYDYSVDGTTYQAGGIFNGLSAATYTITVRDANLCTIAVTVNITEPAVLSIALTITGGTQPYSAIWSDGISTADRQSIPDGTYSVVVTDLHGCAESIDVVVDVTGSGNCIEIPEIITPNNDGYNDTWIIRNIDLFPNAEVFVFSFIFGASIAQQVPMYSQYIMNGFLINPFFAGRDGYTTVNLTVREQWVGLEGAPSTYAASFQTRILKNSYISKSTSVRKKLIRPTKGGKVGLGGYVFNDNNGIMKRTGIQAAYAYHIAMGQTGGIPNNLSFGLALTAYQYAINTDGLLYNHDDPLLNSYDRSVFIPDFNFGTSFTTSKYYVGFAMTNLIRGSLIFGDTSSTARTELGHYFLTGGVKFPLTCIIHAEDKRHK